MPEFFLKNYGEYSRFCISEDMLDIFPRQYCHTLYDTIFLNNLITHVNKNKVFIKIIFKNNKIKKPGNDLTGYIYKREKVYI